MPARKVRRKALVPDFIRRCEEYLLNRSMRERSSYYEGSYKAELMEHLAEAGELEEGGHRKIIFDTPLPFVDFKGGKPHEKTIIGIERKRRVTTSLNEERTMKLLDRLDLVPQCTTTITVLNEDAVLAANYNGIITDEDLAACYDEDENFAFYLVEER